MVKPAVGYDKAVLAICRGCPARHLLAVHSQGTCSNVMGILDVLENDKDLNTLFGLPLQQVVEAILGHAGPAQAELCSRLARPRK